MSIMRSLEEIEKSSDTVTKAEEDMLRDFYKSAGPLTDQDLIDPYGLILLNADLSMLKAYTIERVLDLSDDYDAAVDEIYQLRWGATRSPVYHVLTILKEMKPELHQNYVAIAEFFMETMGVPVDGTDLTGTTALMYAMSNSPWLDIEYAQLLLDYGADINYRNRYDFNAVQYLVPPEAGPSAPLEKVEEALRWFLSHGGNVETPRAMAPVMENVLNSFMTQTEGEDKAPLALPEAKPETKPETKIGRNDPCSCGSSKKFKKCCGRISS